MNEVKVGKLPIPSYAFHFISKLPQEGNMVFSAQLCKNSIDCFVLQVSVVKTMRDRVIKCEFL